MLGAAIWIGPAIAAMFSEITSRRLHSEPAASPRDLLFRGGDWLVYAVIAPIIFWISRKWPVVRPHVARRALLHVTFALLFCVAWATLGKLLDAGLMFLLEPAQMHATIVKAGDALPRLIATNVADWILVTIPFGIVVYCTVAGLAHAVRYFDEVRDRDVQMARLSEQLAGARFSALQAQLNPHFLFNTLNTIAVRARDGEGAATARVVEQLSDLLRRTLSRHQANEVSLGEELDLVRQYLSIEQARFSDRLRPTFDVDDTLLAAAVPSFALQHLAENAVRHGIARLTGAGQLAVGARRIGDALELTVADDGPGIGAGIEPPPGHGIANTRERLTALYGARGSLDVRPLPSGGTVARLRIPFHEHISEQSGVNDAV